MTIAEYFRDDLHQDALLLIDSIFRFVQAAFILLDERERSARSALARLEAGEETGMGNLGLIGAVSIVTAGLRDRYCLRFRSRPLRPLQRPDRSTRHGRARST